MDLISSSYLRGLYLLFVATLTFLIIILTPIANSIVQTHWLVWTALSLSLIAQCGSLLMRLRLLKIVVIFAIAAVLITNVCMVSYTLFIAYLFLLCLIGVWFVQKNPQYLLPNIIIFLSAVQAIKLTPSLHVLISVIEMMVLGLLIVFAAQLVFAPFKLKQQQKNVELAGIDFLRQLNQEIFSCFLAPEYVDAVYLYERRLHVQRAKFMQAQVEFKKIEAAKRWSGFSFRNELDKVFDGMLDYAQLRRRVTDHTIFTVCAEELSAILKAIDQLLTEIYLLRLGKLQALNPKPLASGILRLEESYHNVLQIAAREPLDFLIFISSLKLFQDTLTRLAQRIQLENADVTPVQ